MLTSWTYHYEQLEAGKYTGVMVMIPPPGAPQSSKHYCSGRRMCIVCVASLMNYGH